MKKNSPILACILSFLLPGAGHWYLGQWGTGFANMFFVLGATGVWMLCMPENMVEKYLHYIVFMGAIGSASFAYSTAKQLQDKSDRNGKS